MGYLSYLLEIVVEWVVGFISDLGYWGIAIGMAIESANIPLPSEVILPFGGYLVSTGRLDFFWAAMAGTIGGTVGSIISYFIGLWGGRPFLLRYGRYIGISHKHFELAERWFHRYGEATVFFTRLMPVVRTFISLPAGISGMNFPRFVIYTFLGSLPWSFFLTYLGLKMGQHWQDLKYWFHRLDLVVALGLLVLVVYLWRKRKR
ncbi:membrane protein DedA with SNARE-associated domain [Desulfofundulus luciae]|uniref:Membrane protein DedA with SNARE-associated domain n=1 Tax=Desulfofundulus luciae TaxID=74702 RepID=A0ABU0B006_9FIRM|nr:DedA family protein [Desulfofundulus luciae]MDQ0286035.1 membrane protein DedA with SNARE-associated domain [Desulfofundulus luciae]